MRQVRHLRARRAGLAADRGRRLDREPRPDRRGRPSSSGLPAERRSTRPRRPAWSSSAVTVRFRHPLVRSAVYNAAPGARAPTRPRARCPPRPPSSAWSSSRPGTPPRRPLGTDAGGRRPAGAGRRPGRSTRRVRLARQRAGAGRRADPARAAASTPGWSPPPRRRWRPAPRSSAKSLLDDVDDGPLDPRRAGRLIAVRASLALFTADPAPAARRRPTCSTPRPRVPRRTTPTLEQDDADPGLRVLPARRAAQRQGITLPELGAPAARRAPSCGDGIGGDDPARR